MLNQIKHVGNVKIVDKKLGLHGHPSYQPHQMICLTHLSNLPEQVFPLPSKKNPSLH